MLGTCDGQNLTDEMRTTVSFTEDIFPVPFSYMVIIKNRMILSFEIDYEL